MKIEGIRTLSGPNIYNHNPVLVMRLQLGDLTDIESHQVSGFIERLVNALPGVRNHHCAQGRPGGFVQRLHGGTYFGHIVEHVALELTDAAGIPVNYGKTLYAGEPGLYNVVVEYKAEQGMRCLLRIAVELVQALVKDQPFPLEKRIEEARDVIARTELGPSTRAIVGAAARRGIPWTRIGSGSLVQLGYGKNRKLIEAAVSSNTWAIACDIAGDKALTKSILEQASIPVPRAEVVQTEDEAAMVLEEIGPPVVVKPLDSRQGSGVSLDLKTVEEVKRAFEIARRYSRDVIVEQMLAGRDYRVLVVNGKVVAASQRRPASVTGDGEQNIRELIEIENRNPLRGEGHEKPLTKIAIDSLVVGCLEKRGLSLDCRPARGEVVRLRGSANLSTGGTATDVTELVHPEIAQLCERAARAVGLDICGVDLVIEDISKPLSEGAGGIVELNAAPGLRMHLYPSEGAARDVGAEIIEMLYPEGASARVPVVSVTGTNGKTTVTRMIAHVISSTGKTVGMTTTDGIYVGGQCLTGGDRTGPQSARTVLADPAVEAAVLETARGGIARRGLGYDWSDISVITNIRPDHIGQDGIKSIDDLAHIKSLVAERVREGGALVLNADDEQLARLMENRRVNRIKRNVVFFSLSEHHLTISRHISAGGMAYFLKDGWIMEATRRSQYRIVQAHTMPVTMMGTARFQIANALAAIAASRAYGISRERVAAAIASFRSDLHNPGRANIFEVAGGYVMIDYGHNPDAFEAIARMAATWEGRRVSAIIGVPGDRGDSLIAQAGRAAARGFKRIIIREDKDLRGRRPGEVPSLLRQAIKDEAPERECKIVPDECEALADQLQKIGYGEIVVLFYEKLDRVLGVLNRHGAVAVSEIEGLAPQLSFMRV